MRIITRFMLLLLAAMSWASARAQNLVVNGSFEEYSDCPANGGYLLGGWESPYTSSADYFHTCASPGSWGGVPLSHFGYQHPAHGEGYVGMITYKDDDPLYREFMAAELLEPLVVGVPVCLSFKMAVGGFGSLGFVNSAILTAKGVGLKFFIELPSTSQPWLFSEWTSYLYPNSAALHSNEAPRDTAIWYSVSGTYVPDSAYTHLVIGNFFEDALSGAVLLDRSGHGNWNVAYAFIDDVRVSFDLAYCDLVSGVADTEIPPMRVYPNPFLDEVTVETGTEGVWDLQLFNSTGALVRSCQGCSGSLIRLPTPSLPPGAYHLRISNSSGLIHSSSLIRSIP